MGHHLKQNLEINTIVLVLISALENSMSSMLLNRLTTISIDRVIKNTSSEMFDKALSILLLDFKLLENIGYE
jgi:hypothetical protein